MFPTIAILADHSAAPRSALRTGTNVSPVAGSSMVVMGSGGVYEVLAWKS